MAEERQFEVSDYQRAIVEIAVESWRFIKTSQRVLEKVDVQDKQKFVSKYNWYIKKLDDALDSVGLKLVNLENTRFNHGVAVSPLNLDDFSEEDILIIDQMLEPIIMGPNGVVKMGTVMLRRL